MLNEISPVRFQPSFETIAPDEVETEQRLSDAMISIAEKTYANTGRAHRCVHAKAHGYLRATFEVLPDLPAPYAQGLFATAATYDAILRFSTTPGDILDDDISMPRGVALKVLGVPGARLPGSEEENTQNYVLGNSPSFQVADAKGFLKQLKPLVVTTGRADRLKRVFSIVSRNAEKALEKVGCKSATLTMLAGQASTRLLGDSFFSQGALLHGDYFSKVALSPLSAELTSLSQKPLDTSGRPNAIREDVQNHFRVNPAAWEFRVQLATSIETMPIEDAAAEWPQNESPYRTVARITALPQDTWADDLRELVEDRLAFNPWTGLAAHRPLGSVMRARRLAYGAARTFRSKHNATDIGEPSTIP